MMLGLARGEERLARLGQRRGVTAAAAGEHRDEYEEDGASYHWH
jgi:hypothetical protein